MPNFIHMHIEYCEEYKRLQRKRDEAGNEYRYFKKTYCAGRMTRELESALEAAAEHQRKTGLDFMNHPQTCPECQALRNAPPKKS
jgi:hypothetical protein